MDHLIALCRSSGVIGGALRRVHAQWGRLPAGRAARIGNAARQRVIDDFLQIRRLLEYFEAIEELLDADRQTAA
jgi:hypothetical protein